MKIQVTMEVDTELDGDRELIEGLVEIFQELQEKYTEDDTE